MNTNLNNLQCVECGQTEEPMIVFVGTMRHEDGTIEELPEGMHPYCDPCREANNITDELNAGRDLRAEAKQAVLDSLAEAVAAGESPSGRDRGMSVIMSAVDTWVGGTDGIFRMLGRSVPARPPEVFEGVSDALKEVDPTTMKIRHSLALITATNTLRDKLSSWDDFVQRTYDHYKQTEGENRARSLLVGFI